MNTDTTETKEAATEIDDIKEVIFIDRTPESTSIRDLEGFTLFTLTKDLMQHISPEADVDAAWHRLNAWIDRMVLCSNTCRHVPTDALQKADYLVNMTQATYAARVAIKKMGRLSKLEERVAQAELRHKERLEGKKNESPASESKDEVQSH